MSDIGAGVGSTMPPGESIISYLSAVHRLANTLAEKPLLPEHDISIAHWLVLFEARGETLPVARLRNKCGLSRQRLHTLLSELESGGYVSVAVTEGGDRRVRNVTITPKGRGALASLEGMFANDDVSSLGKNGAHRLMTNTRFVSRITKMLATKETGAGEAAAA